MNKTEIKQALKILGDDIERRETIIEGKGQCLSVQFVGGGQRIYHSMDEVKNWADERDMRRSAYI